MGYSSKSETDFWEQIINLNQISDNNDKEFSLYIKQYFRDNIGRSTAKSFIKPITKNVKKLLKLKKNVPDNYYSLAIKDIQQIIQNYVTHGISYSRLLLCREILKDDNNFIRNYSYGGLTGAVGPTGPTGLSYSFGPTGPIGISSSYSFGPTYTTPVISSSYTHVAATISTTHSPIISSTITPVITTPLTTRSINNGYSLQKQVFIGITAFLAIIAILYLA